MLLISILFILGVLMIYLIKRNEFVKIRSSILGYVLLLYRVCLISDPLAG